VSRLDEIERSLEDADGGRGQSRCHADGYPTSLDCQCGHGHTRHVGKRGMVRCMSYTRQPDCSCIEFVPAAPGVRYLFENTAALLAFARGIEALESTARDLAQQAAADEERTGALAHTARRLGHENTANALRVALDALEATP
jgi:hypothetical protein